MTLQTSDLGAPAGSNNPLFGPNIGQSPGQFQTNGAAGVVHQGEGAGQVGGRGRGKRGPSKRGRKKVGEGRGGPIGAENLQEEGKKETENLQEVAIPRLPAEPMLKVGPLSLRASILDEILSEKKAQLLDDPTVAEFLRQHGIKQ